MRCLIIVPWRPGCEHRERALRWVTGRYDEIGARWVLAEHLDGPWNKAKAVMPAVEQAPDLPIVVADADVWSDDLALAVHEVAAGRPWAVPHLHVHRLTEQATTALYAGQEPPADRLAERPYVGVPGGGLIVAQRQVLLDVPFDRRFDGWGGEDHALGYALDTLYGAPSRGCRPLTHLWHPPQPRSTRRVGSGPSEKLRRRYRDARSDRAAMRSIIEEGRHASECVHAEPERAPRATSKRRRAGRAAA